MEFYFRCIEWLAGMAARAGVPEANRALVATVVFWAGLALVVVLGGVLLRRLLRRSPAEETTEAAVSVEEPAERDSLIRSSCNGRSKRLNKIIPRATTSATPVQNTTVATNARYVSGTPTRAARPVKHSIQRKSTSIIFTPCISLCKKPASLPLRQFPA